MSSFIDDGELYDGHKHVWREDRDFDNNYVCIRCSRSASESNIREVDEFPIFLRVEVKETNT